MDTAAVQQDLQRVYQCMARLVAAQLPPGVSHRHIMEVTFLHHFMALLADLQMVLDGLRQQRCNVQMLACLLEFLSLHRCWSTVAWLLSEASLAAAPGAAAEQHAQWLQLQAMSGAPGAHSAHAGLPCTLVSCKRNAAPLLAHGNHKRPCIASMAAGCATLSAGDSIISTSNPRTGNKSSISSTSTSTSTSTLLELNPSTGSTSTSLVTSNCSDRTTNVVSSSKARRASWAASITPHQNATCAVALLVLALSCLAAVMLLRLDTGLRQLRWWLPQQLRQDLAATGAVVGAWHRAASWHFPLHWVCGLLVMCIVVACATASSLCLVV